MQETKLTAEMTEIVSNNNGLYRYLSGLAEGRRFTPRSSLYNLEGKTAMLAPDEILEQWLKELTTLESGDAFSDEVYQFDSRQTEKWGPQGGIAPIDELLDSLVYPSFLRKDKATAFTTAAWKQAKRNVEKYLHRSGCVGLSPVPYRRVVDDMRARDTLESNSGWPLFTRRNKPEVVTQSIQEAENGLWKTYPAIALFRNYNRKTRLVWMFPMSANLVEGSYFQMIQSILMRSAESHKFLAPWTGFEEVRKLITEQYSSKRYVAASDFSATDEHFRLAASMEVCSVLETCFQPRFREGLRESIQYMHTIPLVIGVDRMLTGEHGVSSGSNWTNFIETIFDWIFAEYVKLGGAYEGLFAIGDDMAWSSSEYDEKFADKLATYGEKVGQDVKAEKTTNDRDKVKSLQRLFQRGYVRPDGQIRAVYPTVRALKSLVYPERFHKPELWSKDMEVIRNFMILENCIDHPLFEALCKFVAAGDPYMKVFAMKSSQEQRRLHRQSKLVPGLNTTYNQEKRDQALENFKSVELIRSL
jgi:hypothetical protein